MSIEGFTRLSPTAVGARLAAICELGNRYVGTPGEQAARGFLLEEFQQADLSNVRVEDVNVVAYKPKRAICATVNPEMQWKGAGLQFTASERREAEAVYIGSGSDAALERLQRIGAIEGRIVVVHSYWPFEFAEALEDSGAVGIVVIAGTPTGVIPHFTARMYPPGQPLGIPGVTVGETAGRELLSLMSLGPRTVVIDHEADYETTATGNVIGELPGVAMPGERVVVGAHYDTQLDGIGACDNASGVAALVEIACAWVTWQPPARTVVFVAFADEEHGFSGAIDYCRRHQDSVESTVAMVNLDALGWLFPCERSMHVDSAMRSFAQDCARAVGWEPENELEASLMQASDHNPFIDAGIPAVLFWHYPPQHPFYHAAGDDLELMSFDAVADAATAAAYTVFRLATDVGIQLGRSQPSHRRLDLRPPLASGANGGSRTST